MDEGVAEALLTTITIIVFMVILGLAMTAIFQVTGSGENPGLIDSVMQILSGRYVRLGG